LSRGRQAVIILIAALLPLAGCLNPFAPGLDSSPAESSCNPLTVDGVFQCFQNAYTFRDTTIYGQLVDRNFVFVYFDYDISIDVTWGRDDEMRTTYQLFQNAQKLDLIWGAILSSTTDSNQVSVVRGFNLTVTWNPTSVESASGYANMTFARNRSVDPWKIVQWRDESNF
jgi:hypothetical protein